MFEHLPRFPAFLDREGKKIPIYDDWQKIATTDKKIIDAWFEKHKGPNFLWGIPTGEQTGIYALDIDVKNDKNGFEFLKKHNHFLPNTTHQQTRSGGYHLIFRYPKGSNFGNRAGIIDRHSGLDTRGEGGWIVDYGFTKSTVPLIDPPQWLLDNARKREIEVYENGSNYTLSPELTKQRIEEIIQKIIDAPQGSGNDILNAQSFEMGRLVSAGVITLEEARKLLIQAGTHNNRRSEYEAQATVESGLEGGVRVPLNCPFDVNPQLTVIITDSPELSSWTPRKITVDDLKNTARLKQPQLFKDWSSCDISLLNAEGGTGKTTLLLYEAVCMRLGDRFLGFECIKPNGKTLFITGEDSDLKLMARLGQILDQTGVLNNPERTQHILDGIYIKKDADMCIVVRDKSGVWYPNPEAYQKVAEAVRQLKPDKLVIDPLAAFWGPESQVNDMARGVIRFVGKLVEEFGICVEMVHHLGSEASKSKELGQFSGRGGSVIPSHSRVVKSMVPISSDELDEFVGGGLADRESAILCNIGKFTDGSEMLGKPFVIIRNGFVFRREPIVRKVVEQPITNTALPEKEILDWVIEQRKLKRYPSKAIINGHFAGKIPKGLITQALTTLSYFGYEGRKITLIDDPVNMESRNKVYIVVDDKGVEI